MESSVRSRAQAFVKKVSGSNESCNNNNPFVQVWDAVAGEEGYGRPPEGSLTEARGIKAHLHVHKEIEQLCDIIKTYGIEVRDGWIVTFGQIFSIYVTISDKVVGLLLRARKHGLVDFAGEMLYQRRDEEVEIMLRKEPRTPCVSRTPSPMPSRSPSPNPLNRKTSASPGNNNSSQLLRP